MPPFYEYDHGTGLFEGIALIGGYIYRGPIGTVEGEYFFGDLVGIRPEEPV